LTEPHLHRVHGLTIASDVPLDLAPGAVGQSADLTLRIGDFRPVQPPSDGDRPYSRIDLPGGQTYRIDRRGEGWRVTFDPIGQFESDADFRTVVAHPVDDAGLQVLRVLAASTLLAIHLVVNGNPVLHASAVQVGDAALGFAGTPGTGKSTMATLFALAGHSLIADDVLRLDLGQPVQVFRGEPRTRLRASARSLAAGLPRDVQQDTVDGRLALAFPAPGNEMIPLAALVLPRPDRTGRGVRANRLTPAEATRALLGQARVAATEDRQQQVRNFEDIVTVAQRVPVWEVRVPWGPPFPAGVAADVLDAMEWPET
jgi:hypothetical protein